MVLFNTKSNVTRGFVNTVELKKNGTICKHCRVKKNRTLVSGLAAESLSSDVLIGLYLVAGSPSKF